MILDDSFPWIQRYHETGMHSDVTRDKEIPGNQINIH